MRGTSYDTNLRALAAAALQVVPLAGARPDVEVHAVLAAVEVNAVAAAVCIPPTVQSAPLPQGFKEECGCAV